MADFPALPLWTDAYIADTQHLTNEEHGVYLRLLMFAWRSPSCSLPDDDKRLAIMVGVTPKVWQRLKPIVMSFWSCENGVWEQKRLTAQRDFVELQREQKRSAGKASARAKRLKSNDLISTAVATGKSTEGQQKGNNHIHNHNHSNASHYMGGSQEPTPKPKKVDRGSRISQDWNLSQELRIYAQEKGLSDEQITLEAEKFKNYWLGASGAKAVKRDWGATWRNWILRASEDIAKRNAQRSGNARSGGGMSAMVAGFEQAAVEGSERDRRDQD